MVRQKITLHLWLLVFISAMVIGCGAPPPPPEAVVETIETIETIETVEAVEAVEPETLRGNSSAIDPDLDELTAFIEAQMDENNIPGVAVAVVRGPEPLLLEGFGWRDVEAEQPVTPDTLFHIGSTHKSMTAMLAATLVDDGLLDWDTPAIELNPDFALADEESTETVTLRHLLSMRSGIPDEAEDEFDIDSSQAEDVIPFLADVPLLGKPGEAFSYSNLSLSAAGYLLVRIANPQSDDLYGDYAALLSERLLQPIGMETAVVRASEAQASPNLSRSYLLDDDDQPLLAETEDWDGDPLAPSGSLKASAREMGWYISTQLARGVAPNGNRVVSADSLTETWQPYLEDYGMGWQINEVDGVTMIWHEGSFDNFLSVIGFFPEQEVGFVILTNSEEAAGTLIDEAPWLLAELVGE